MGRGGYSATSGNKIAAPRRKTSDDILYGHTGPRSVTKPLSYQAQWEQLLEEGELNDTIDFFIDEEPWVTIPWNGQFLSAVQTNDFAIPDNERKQVGANPFFFQKRLQLLSAYFTKAGPKKHLGALATIKPAKFSQKDSRTRNLYRKKWALSREEQVEDSFDFPEEQIRAIEILNKDQGEWFVAPGSDVEFQFDGDIKEAYASEIAAFSETPFLLYVDKHEEYWGFKDRKILGYVLPSTQ